MSHPLADILTFTPCYQTVVWGGRRLEAWRDDLPDGPIGESWELADQERGMSVVDHGPFAGRSLRELCAEYPRELVGAAFAGGEFPLLVKIIDANDRLSVQVHPDDALATELGVAERGKTECWFMLGDGGELFQGTKSPIDRAAFQQALEREELEATLNRFVTTDGDFFFMPARTVHALGKGCLLFEVQQSCDCTFRVYDWGRVGLDGKPRPLHVEESLRTIDFSADNRYGPVQAEWHDDRRMLARCPYFGLDERRGDDLEGGSEESCDLIMCLSGSGQLRAGSGSVTLEAMRTYLVPAVAGGWHVEGSDVRLLHAWPEL